MRINEVNENIKMALPISEVFIKQLFEYLCRNISDCDCTLRKTKDFLKSRNLDVDKTIAWLEQNGGYCDCEVIFNVKEKFGALVRR